MKLKKLDFIFGYVLLIILVSGIARAAAPVITVNNSNPVATLGETVNINIEVDGPSQVAAAVFSIIYDSAALSFNSLDASAFFDQFTVNAGQPGTIMFCGAKTVPSGSGPTVIANLSFEVLEDATQEYTIDVAVSSITDPDAGYADSTPINAFTGADPYPVLAAGTAGATPGQLSIDRDDDGLTDTEEINLGIGMNIDSPDTDGDGMGDSWEVFYSDFVNPVEADAFVDADGDGYSNLREFIAGTDPGTTTDAAEMGLIADIDWDEDVDGKDLHELANELNNCSGPYPSCACDFDGDDEVNDIDMKLFLEDFGR